jgi:ATP-dependent Lon protease
MNRLHQFRRVHWPRPLSYMPTECIVTFPTPGADDPDALLPAVIASLLRERGLNQSWMPPPNGLEHAAVAQHWRGGSVRRSPCMADAILDRDLLAKRN